MIEIWDIEGIVLNIQLCLDVKVHQRLSDRNLGY